MDKEISREKRPRRRRDAVGVQMSPNQVVAWNLARARELRGWTQNQAAEALAPHLGSTWSKASFSQAERSVTGKVTRKFDADELVAFARTFDLPVAWFFLPPPPIDAAGKAVRLSTPDARRLGTEIALLVDLVFGTEQSQPLIAERLREFINVLGPSRLTRAQHRVAALAEERVAAIMSGVLGEIGQWQTWLRNIANHLEDLERRSRTTGVEHDATAQPGG
jgi:transcriptional regulator with XRE-family HTH domain